MRIEREVLENNLKDIINEYGRVRKVVQQVTSELQNKNMIEGDISSLFKLTTPISSVNQFVLYAFTKSLFNATKEPKINPSEYFTKIEIEDGDKWKHTISKTEKDREPVVFRDCIKINENTWLTALTNQEMFNLFNVRTLVYNVKTQRPLKVTEKNGKIIERIDINPTAVHEIEALILEDLFIPDPFTINAMYNANLNMEVDDKSKTITFYSGELNLTDGNHRMRGEFKALVKNPNLLRNIPILLTRLTEDRAKDYIFQKSQHNPLNEKFKKTINPSRLSNQVIEFLNTEKKSLLRGRIAKDSTMLKSVGSKAVVEFNTLADTIDFTFAPKEQSELFALNMYIMNGLNHIIHVFGSLLKEHSEPKIWCIYICMLYLVDGADDWEKSLDDLLTEVNIDNIPFKTINKIGVRNVLSEIKKYLPETNTDEGVEDYG